MPNRKIARKRWPVPPLLGAVAVMASTLLALPAQASLVAAFLGMFVLGVAAAIPATGWMGIHLMTGAQIACIMAIFIAGALLFSSTLASQMVPGSFVRFPLRALLPLSGAALIGGIALLFPWRVVEPFTSGPIMSGSFTSEGWPCAALELVVAAPAAALVWLVVRRGAAFRSPALGASVAALSVFLALTVVQSQCMLPQAPHILVWHAGVGALLIGCGALAGLASRRSQLHRRSLT